MQRYAFESRLSPEQILLRLSVYARKTDSFGWRISGSDDFYYSAPGPERFYLVKARAGWGGAAAVRQPVFCARLSREGSVTHIRGSFYWHRRQLGMMALPVLLLLLFSWAVSHTLWLPLLAAAFAALGLMAVLRAASVMYRREEQEVLRLLEQHFLQ